jgi:hypothetical protein
MPVETKPCFEYADINFQFNQPFLSLVSQLKAKCYHLFLLHFMKEALVHMSLPQGQKPVKDSVFLSLFDYLISTNLYHMISLLRLNALKHLSTTPTSDMASRLGRLQLFLTLSQRSKFRTQCPSCLSHKTMPRTTHLAPNP